MNDVTAFTRIELSDAEVDAIEDRYGPIADALRTLNEATIQSTVDDAVATAALGHIREATALLSRSLRPGPAGVNYNATGRAWNWGNAAVGVRNAVAPPMDVQHGDRGVTWAELTLGPAYEGPPGCVHGGVSALLLDHLMGVTASNMERVTLTGTLTMRYRAPLPLGLVRLDGRISGEEGRKVFVEASIAGPDGVAIEADGIFIIPRWSGEFESVVSADAGPA